MCSYIFIGILCIFLGVSHISLGKYVLKQRLGMRMTSSGQLSREDSLDVTSQRVQRQQSCG